MPYAYTPQAVTLYLEDELDISRGDCIAREKNVPAISRTIEANIVWMDESPLELGKTYIIKHTARTVRGVVREVHYRFDPEDLHRKPAGFLHLNEIGKVSLSLMQPIFTDTYDRNRQTGCFILIDPLTNHTAGAGMVTRCLCRDEGAPRVTASDIPVLTHWFVTGETPGPGQEYFVKMRNAGIPCLYLDDVSIEQGICADIDRRTDDNRCLQRIAHVCRIANDSGITVIVESKSAPGEEVHSIVGKDNVHTMRSSDSNEG